MNVLRLIVGDALNFSLGGSEAWGPNARIDPVADFFFKKVPDIKLIDPNLNKYVPTWRNNWVGEANIAKMLDHFLLCDDFSSEAAIFHQ